MKTIKAPIAEQLPSGSWRCRVMVDGRSKAITGANRIEVERKALAWKSGTLKEASLPVSSLTISQMIDYYIEYKYPSLSPSTIRGYRFIQRNRFPTIMDRRPDSMTDEAFQQAISKESSSSSAKTLKNSWALISASIKFETGRSINAYLPKVVQDERPFLQPEQIEIFVSAIRGQKVEIAALLGLHGLRRSEILGLRWSCVDLKKRQIHVQGSTVFNSDDELINKPDNKTRSSRRTVPIMMDQLYLALKSVPETDRGDFVVTCHPNTIRKQINRICQANGLPLVGTHGLRHSFCSLAYHLGVSEKVAMQIGGWSDYQTMRRIYTHVAESDLSNAVSAFTDFFSSQPASNP